MITNNNVLVFNFGDNLNFMYKIVKTFLDKKSDKKSLVFRKDLTYKESKDNKYEVINFDENLFKTMNLNDYGIVILEQDFDKRFLEVINREEYKDLMFFFASRNNGEILENMIHCDLSLFEKMSFIQKTMKLSEIKKKLSGNKKVKKFKIF